MQQKIVLWFTAIAVAFGSMAGLAVKTVVAQTAPASLIISSVQITGGPGKTADDFIELFNPNPYPVDLNSYRLVKRTATGSADSSIKAWPSETLIPPYSFYLWANTGYLEIGVVPDTTTSSTLADNNGVALRFGPLDSGQIIDSISWGSADNGFFLASFENPGAGESLARISLFENLGHEIVASMPRNTSVQSLPDELPVSVNDALCEVNPASITAEPNQAVAVGLQFTNIGNTVWGELTHFVKQSNQNGVLNIALGASINPIGKLELAAQVTAPANVGEYQFTWQMAEGANLFGQNCALSLTVANGSEPDPNPNPTPSPTTVRITELLPNPAGDDSGKEQVELYNFGLQPVNITDWILDDINSWPVSSNHYKLGELIIAAGQYLTVTIPAGKFALNNTGGDVLTLFSSNGSVISTVSYTGTAPEGKSYSLIADQWHWTAPSFGLANPSLPTTEPIDPVNPPTQEDPTNPPAEPPVTEPVLQGLIISEVYPAPSPTAKEFVELYNGSGEPLNLKYAKLVIGNRVASLPDLLLPSGGYYAVMGEELKLPLADAGKTIQLLGSDSTILHQVTYPKAFKGQSYALFGEEFAWTNQPTPGIANVFVGSSTTKTGPAKPSAASAVKTAIAKNLTNLSTPAKSPGLAQTANPSNVHNDSIEKKGNPWQAIPIALASLCAGVFAVYRFGFLGA
ncbi:MAG TPA: lamin tail domain-containing protein [Candidatus Doudnabacteria bacterium]|nr:lamin tail domain-containing protein [Candidatus Doudnabacteria bacterium]